MEQWKTCTDVPRIEVSNLGGIREAKTGRKWYVAPDKLGYVVGQYGLNGKKKTFKLHRLVAKEFVDNPNGYLEVNHIDGDKLNNKAENLEWCTRQQNVRHAFDMGLNKPHIGECNGRSILNEEIVRNVCKYFQDSPDNTPKKATEIFGISMQQATKIRARIAWKHISKDYDFVPLKKRRSKFRD